MTERRRVLVVDDHAGMLEMLRAFLTAEGDQGRYVGSPLLLAAALADGWVPDVAVIDLMMPEQDGVQVAQWIREQYPAARIVVYSAWPGAETLASVKQTMVADVYLPKPFDLDALLAAMAGDT